MVTLQPNRKTRILCVDDHQDTFDLIKVILKDYEIITAESVGDGVRRATGEQFDLYLLDYHLPDGNGIELCLLIRQFDKTTPILFITGTRALLEREIQQAGAQGLVPKGFEFLDLLPMAITSLISLA